MTTYKWKTAVITLSDKGFKGEREDKSGSLICEMVSEAGFEVVTKLILPDEQKEIEECLKRICDAGETDLILTTGGTGLAPRDCTPEATMAVAHKQVPGISEAMRAASMQITPRGMLSRGVSVIRGNTLIINLPGSPKAVRENLEVILSSLDHGLAIMTGKTGECAV